MTSWFTMTVYILKCLTVGIFYIHTERQKSFTTSSFDIFWIKIDGFKNRKCSKFIFLPLQKTVVAEKSKEFHHAYIFGEEFKIVTFGHKMLQFICYLYGAMNWKNNFCFVFENW